MITPLVRTSAPFHYHERVIGDVWCRLDGAPAPHAFADTLAALANARHTVHLALPHLTVPAFTDALAAAVAQHRLRCYVLTTDGLSPGLANADKQAHAAALAKLSAAGATLQSTSRLHARFLLLDVGEPTVDARVFPFGLPGPEGDEPVHVLPSRAAALQEAFALAWWRLSVERLTKQGAGKATLQPGFPADQPIAGLAVDLKSAEKPSAESPARAEIAVRLKAILEPAQQRVWASLPQPESQSFLVEALLAKAALPGADVRVLTTHRPAATETLRKLALGGVQVRHRIDVRATTWLADGQGLVLATGSGAKDEKPGLELAVQVDGADLSALASAFEASWKTAAASLRPQAKFGELQSPYQLVGKDAPGAWLPPPVESKLVVLDTPWTAHSATDLAASPPHKDAKDDPGCGALTLTYRWTIVPPKLPADAKEEFRTPEEAERLGLPPGRAPHDPRRFSRGKELFLLAERDDPIYLTWLRQTATELKARVVVPRG
jgi:hypothetical protein